MTRALASALLSFIAVVPAWSQASVQQGLSQGCEVAYVFQPIQSDTRQRDSERGSVLFLHCPNKAWGKVEAQMWTNRW